MQPPISQITENQTGVLIPAVTVETIFFKTQPREFWTQHCTMSAQVPKPHPLDSAACTIIRDEVYKRLLAQYPDQALVGGVPAFSSVELCTVYTSAGGISRWLGRRRKLYTGMPRAQDLYWSALADLLNSDKIAGTELIAH